MGIKGERTTNTFLTNGYQQSASSNLVKENLLVSIQVYCAKVPDSRLLLADRLKESENKLCKTWTGKDRHRESGVTWRAILIAIFLIPPNVFWVIEVECVWHSGHPTTISLFWNVVLNIFFLILVNLFLKRTAPRAALTQGEMITIYAMLSIASGLAGHDTLALTIPALPHAFWFATLENDWADMFHSYIPQHLVVSDKELIRGFYEGNTPFYNAKIGGAWIKPTLWWTSFILALGTIMICLNVLIRKQWTEHEKLAYPIIQLPMAITEGGGAAKLFRNRILWYGFIAAALLNVWHGLAHFFPVLPDFSVRHNARNWEGSSRKNRGTLSVMFLYRFIPL